jgi:hypothetical protein
MYAQENTEGVQSLQTVGKNLVLPYERLTRGSVHWPCRRLRGLRHHIHGPESAKLVFEDDNYFYSDSQGKL